MSLSCPASKRDDRDMPAETQCNFVSHGLICPLPTAFRLFTGFLRTVVFYLCIVLLYLVALCAMTFLPMSP
jgi:hypothetical protein